MSTNHRNDYKRLFARWLTRIGWKIYDDFASPTVRCEFIEDALHSHFVRFSSKQDAAAAILSTHLRKINGHTAKCAWSRRSESSDLPAAKPRGPMGCGQSLYPAAATLGTISPYPRIADRVTAAAISGVSASEQVALCSCQTTATWPTYCGDANNCAVARFPSIVTHHSSGTPVISSSPYYVWVDYLMLANNYIVFAVYEWYK